MAEEWTSDKVRTTFIDFFKSKEHNFVPSSPVVPLDDPTLLFTNAGMNQFKPVFLGQVDETSNLFGMKRAANSQKCIRAGGKHNDLDDVGKDVYHHTMFEMLGNWSFGDFFKKEAIAWAVELLTEVYKIPKDRLYATYFEGDEGLGLPADIEAKELWLQYLPPHAVLPGDKKDNFWMMGDTGPCGPCSEIHYDRIGGRNAAHLVNQDDPDVLEVWNIVFIQYNASKEGKETTLELLPHKHIDTGMGFERIASVIMNKSSNYDTDIFTYLFDALQENLNLAAYAGKVGADDTEKMDMTYRVIADHIRTVSFALADGAHIGNQGRDYVLRRIVRRACRYGRQYFKAEPGFFSALVPVLVNKMGGFFPELKKDPAAIQAEILEEEQQFFRTLDRGSRKFEEFAAKGVVRTVTCIEGEELVENTYTDKRVVDGNDAFMLYDTFGFPLDLTDLMAEERDMKVDHEVFKRCMEEQKRRSRGEGEGAAKKMVLEAAQTDELEKKGVEKTVDISKYTWDAGEGSGDVLEATVKAIFTSGKTFVEEASEGEEDFGFVLDKTSFYAEAGGQIYDTGVLSAGETKIDVLDCKQFGKFILHMGTVLKGSIKVGDKVNVEVNYKRRAAAAKNHTTTHLMNYGLRKVLGGKVDQRGSLVVPDKLRFDFTSNKAVNEAQLIEVQQCVQEMIDAKQEVHTQECALADARAICSLRAVFGEKYPDPVRVVSVGAEINTMIGDPDNEAWKAFSVEFCGGTHLSNASQADIFLITSEEPVSKGVRRITAVTGNHARNVLDEYEEIKQCIQACDAMEPAQKLKESKVLMTRVEQAMLHVQGKSELIAELKRIRKALTAYEKELMNKKKEKALNDTKELCAKLKEKEYAEKSMVLKFDGDKSVVNDVVVLFHKEFPETAIFALGMDEGNEQMVVITSTPASLKEALPADKWCNAGVSVASGKGGGKPDRAQGNAKGLADANKICEAAVLFATEKFSQ